MDGNRRWARGRGLPAIAGHVQGVEAIKPIVRVAPDHGIQVLSLYVFSRENWRRTNEEVSGLFGLIEGAIRSNVDELVDQGVRVHVIGRLADTPAELRAAIGEAEDRTQGGRKMILNIAFNYSGRAEIVDAVRSAIAAAPAEELDEDRLAAYLYTAGQPDPDLIIRTGGEQRTSNFLLWQGAYAELVFCETLWPDFTESELKSALAEFERRHRRFGT